MEIGLDPLRRAPVRKWRASQQSANGADKPLEDEHQIVVGLGHASSVSRGRPSVAKTRQRGACARRDLLGAGVRGFFAGASVEGAAPNRERRVWTAGVGRIKARHEVTTGRIRRLNANATSADALVRSRPADCARTTLKRTCAGGLGVHWCGVHGTSVGRLRIGRPGFRPLDRLRFRRRAAHAIGPDRSAAVQAFVFELAAGADGRVRLAGQVAARIRAPVATSTVGGGVAVRRVLRTVGCAVPAACCGGQCTAGQDHLAQAPLPVHAQGHEASVVPTGFAGIHRRSRVPIRASRIGVSLSMEAV